LSDCLHRFFDRRDDVRIRAAPTDVTYSPHLNIAETLWRKLKYEWLRAEDYESKGHLQYAVKQALMAFGKRLSINFSAFKYSLI